MSLKHTFFSLLYTLIMGLIGALAGSAVATTFASGPIGVNVVGTVGALLFGGGTLWFCLKNYRK